LLLQRRRRRLLLPLPALLLLSWAP